VLKGTRAEIGAKITFSFLTWPLDSLELEQI